MTPPTALPTAPLSGFRAFMRFWFSRLASTSANQMLMVAIGWQMYDLTGSAWSLGLVGLLQFLPALLLVLVAGHAVDRYHRARIAMLCLPPAAIPIVCDRLSTANGVLRLTVEPSPSCPLVFRPHASTSPAAVIARE